MQLFRLSACCPVILFDPQSACELIESTGHVLTRLEIQNDSDNYTYRTEVEREVGGLGFRGKARSSLSSGSTFWLFQFAPCFPELAMQGPGAKGGHIWRGHAQMR